MKPLALRDFQPKLEGNMYTGVPRASDLCAVLYVLPL